MATVHMKFANGVAARIHVSWLNPYKEQKLTVVGSYDTAIFDDRVDWTDKVLVYSCGSVFRYAPPGKVSPGLTRFRLEPCEPLHKECAQFLHAVKTGVLPRTDSAE